MPKYILSLDQGTTSSRAILFDSDQNIVAMEQKEFPQIYPREGWVEHDPMEIYSSQYAVMMGLIAKSGIDVSDIAGIGITNQRETTILWDKETGRPVYNAIVWQCRRTADICEDLKRRGLEDYVRKNTGLVIDAYFSGTKIKWILDHVEGLRERAERGEILFGTVDSWLVWKLTNGKVHVTDHTNASRTMIFNINTLEWDERMLKELDIPRCMLPEVRPSSEIYGYINIQGIDVPIAGIAGDQQAALFGQACFKAGQAKNTYGTGCFLLMNTGDKRIHSKNNLIEGIAWGINGKITYDLEGSAFNAGSVIKWLRDELRLISETSECDFLAESVRDSNGVYLVPAFTGLGAPYWDMYARGCIMGLTRGANRAHFARAVLESIAFQVTDLVDAMSKDSGILMSELRVDGGASVSNIMLQIQSNLTSSKVNRPKLVETTALGAAYMAGLAVGFWKDFDEIERVREVDRIFVPAIDGVSRDAMVDGWHKAVDRSRNWEQP